MAAGDQASHRLCPAWPSGSTSVQPCSSCTRRRGRTELGAARRHIKTLVLDLDDVLVHSDWARSRGWRTFKRPGADDFLRQLSARFELVPPLPDCAAAGAARLQPLVAGLGRCKLAHVVCACPACLACQGRLQCSVAGGADPRACAHQRAARAGVGAGAVHAPAAHVHGPHPGPAGHRPLHPVPPVQVHRLRRVQASCSRCHALPQRYPVVTRP